RRVDVLQQHGLAGLRRRDDETALALADGSDQIDRTGRQVLGRSVAPLELQALGGMQRRQVLEQHLAARTLRRIKINFADLEQREITLAVLRRTYQSGYGIAGTQIEAANLAGRHINVVGAREVARIGRTWEPHACVE